MNYFIVSFDRQADTSYKEFHDRFVGNPGVKKWSHHIKSSYIVGTENDVGWLSSHYSKTAQVCGIPVTHIALQVDLSERQGRLPKKAWEWFKRNTV
jgi:hypothetical protein